MTTKSKSTYHDEDGFLNDVFYRFTLSCQNLISNPTQQKLATGFYSELYCFYQYKSTGDMILSKFSRWLTVL